MSGDKDAERTLNGAIYSQVMREWLLHCLAFECALLVGETMDGDDPAWPEHESLLDSLDDKRDAIERSPFFPPCGVN